VYVVCGKHPGWNFDDPKIRVERVDSIGVTGEWGNYWGNNKLHLCNSSAGRVIYLDVDTMVLGNINQIYSTVDTDIIARYGVTTYMNKYYDRKRWYKTLESAGAEKYPKYSPGFVIFQNSAHKKIKKRWNDVILEILRGELPVPVNKHAELYAFSIAASLCGLSHHPMLPKYHRYAMIGEGHKDAVVYHLGSPRFYEHYLRVERDNPQLQKRNLPAPRPSFLKIRDIYTRAKHRLESKLYGSRDSRIDY
jgi:hypothetical protein